MRTLGLLLALVALTACDNVGRYPESVCRERDVSSGTCTKMEFICPVPYEMVASNGRPYCVYSKKS